MSTCTSNNNKHKCGILLTHACVRIHVGILDHLLQRYTQDYGCKLGTETVYPILSLHPLAVTGHFFECTMIVTIRHRA